MPIRPPFIMSLCLILCYNKSLSILLEVDAYAA